MQVVLVGLLLAALSVVYTALELRLNADTNDLISPSRPFMQRYLAFLDEFGDLEYIYVVIEQDNAEAEVEGAAHALVDRLRGIPDLPEVHGTIEPEEQWRVATRAMPIEELEGLVRARAAFELMGESDDARVYLRAARRALQRALRQDAPLNEKERRELGAAGLFLVESTLPAEDPDALARREYLRSETGDLYFLEIMPAKDYGSLAVIREPMARIRAVIEEVRAEFPGLSIGLTGMPVLQADEMATSNRDMTRAALIAFVVCTLLFIAFIGGIRRPLLAVLALACGAAWTFGATTLVVGQLNLLSNVFILVLVGVGVDYGVHVISRYREVRARRSIAESLKEVMQTAVRGNATGAMTSSTAFFAAAFTTFQGLRELGMIAGGGLLLCLLAMTFILPALLVLSDRGMRFSRHAAEPDEGAPAPRRERDPFHFLQVVTDHPRIVLGVCIFLTTVFAFLPGRLHFEENLLELQAEGIESARSSPRISPASNGCSPRRKRARKSAGRAACWT